MEVKFWAHLLILRGGGSPKLNTESRVPTPLASAFPEARRTAHGPKANQWHLTLQRGEACKQHLTYKTGAGDGLC